MSLYHRYREISVCSGCVMIYYFDTVIPPIYRNYILANTASMPNSPISRSTHHTPCTSRRGTAYVMRRSENGHVSQTTLPVNT